MSEDCKVCKRCSGTATEWLLFQSKYKATKVGLCADCFEEARKVFQQLIVDGKKLVVFHAE